MEAEATTQKDRGVGSDRVLDRLGSRRREGCRMEAEGRDLRPGQGPGIGLEGKLNKTVRALPPEASSKSQEIVDSGLETEEREIWEGDFTRCACPQA